MTTWAALVFLVVFLFMVPPTSAQTSHSRTGEAAAKSAASANVQVVPDLDQRLARFRRVEMPFHSTGLTDREQKLVEKLVDASRYLEEIFWRQIDPDGLTLYQSLAGSKDRKRRDAAAISMDQCLTFRPH